MIPHFVGLLSNNGERSGGLGSANPLGYRCIIQAAEKFADLAQRFASGLPNHPHRHILSLQVTARAMPPN
jgi:hypothetical protein